MPGTGPLPEPSVGGIDFVGYDCGGYGLWQTIWDHSWTSTADLVKVGDLDQIIHPTRGQPPGVRWPATPVVMGILDTPPVDATTFLPTGVPFKWIYLYRTPTAVLYSQASLGRDGIPRQAPPTYPLAASGQDLSSTQRMVEPHGIELLLGQFSYNMQDVYACVDILNWLNDDIVMDVISLPIEWFIQFTIPTYPGPTPPVELPPVVEPVISPTQPPTGVINPSVVPPSVQLRQTLEHANPGFTCDITRANRTADVVKFFIGQKVLLTVESERSKIGFHSRGHVITQTRFRWKATGGSRPRKESSVDLRLEKIPGTLLPGAGSSSAAQSAAGTGAEVSSTLRIGVPGTGIGLGGLG